MLPCPGCILGPAAAAPPPPTPTPPQAHELLEGRDCKPVQVWVETLLCRLLAVCP